MPPSWTRCGILAALVAYAVFVAIHVGAVPGGSDTSGYFNEARLFSHLRIHEPVRTIPGLPPDAAPPYLYVPLGFRPAFDGASRLVPTYPPGLSLMLVPAAWVLGWRYAGDFVLVLSSVAGLVLTYRLGRICGLGRGWARAGAALLAMSPLYLYMSFWAMSDVPALVWAAAAVIAAWKSRKCPPWALGAGIFAAIGFLVRPSNFMVVLPMAIAIGASPRRLLLAALGGIPGVAVWMALNHAAYGGYFESGYGDIGNEFHGYLVLGTLRYYVTWLPVALTPLVVLALGIAAFLGSRTRVALMLGSWIVAYVAFYAPYRWTHEDWWFLRFLLPAAPAFLVAALIVLQRLIDALGGRMSEARRLGVLALLLLFSLYESKQHYRPLNVPTIGHGELKYGRVATWLKANIPENAAIAATQFSGAAYFYTGYTVVRLDQLLAGAAGKVQAAAAAQHQPVFAVVFPFETDSLGSLPGTWAKFGTVNDVTIWRSDWGGPAR